MALLPGVEEVYGRLRGAVLAAVDTVQQARATVEAAHRVVLRADRVTAELEEPLLALAPGLARLATLLEDPVVRDLPDTLRRVQDDLLPVLRTVADTHERVAFIAGQTERIVSVVDDATRGLAGLPGAALFGRIRQPAARIVTVEQIDPPPP